MSTKPPDQIVMLPSKKMALWIVIEVFLTILGVFFGIFLTIGFGSLFLRTFVYPHYKPLGVDDAVMTNYFMVVPSILFCVVILGISLWRRVSWWKPLGFILSCILISFWWVNEYNITNFFRDRP